MSTEKKRYLTEYQFLIDDKMISSVLSQEKKSALIGLKKKNAHNLRKNWSIVVVKGSRMNEPGFKINENEIPITDPHFV